MTNQQKKVLIVRYRLLWQSWWERSKPCDGAKPVLFLIDGQWVHKGWLMPELR